MSNTLVRAHKPGLDHVLGERNVARDEIRGANRLTDFLYLHDNRIATLPVSLRRLQQLRYLNISENAFDTLPEAVCQMVGLLELRAEFAA